MGMVEQTDGPSRDEIASILEQAPGKAADAATIHGHLEMKGVEVSRSAVRRRCDELVANGMLAADDTENDRYRLVDRGAE